MSVIDTLTNVSLQCRHEQRYPAPAPAPGDIVYCRQCGDYREILSRSEDYQVRCGHCRLSRTYGRDKEHAYAVASRHVAKFPTHVASIWDGGDVVETIAMNSEQGILPLVEALQTTAQKQHVHHAKLRNVTKSRPDKSLT